MKMNQIKAGDLVSMYPYGGRNTTTERFLGFTKINTKYAEKPEFDTLKEVKAFYNCKTAHQLEYVGDAANLPYGHNVYACFECLRTEEDGGNYTWQAYLHEGRWVLGSSCTKFSMKKVILPAFLKLTGKV